MKRMVQLTAFIAYLTLVAPMSADTETLKVRIHGDDASKPTLIYLPGLHGDWPLVSSFRHEITNHVRFVEFTYPRTVTWSLGEYAQAVASALLENGITEGWILAESFGSQVAWTLVKEQSMKPELDIEGIILAGGFVKHPNNSASSSPNNSRRNFHIHGSGVACASTPSTPGSDIGMRLKRSQASLNSWNAAPCPTGRR